MGLFLVAALLAPAAARALSAASSAAPAALRVRYFDARGAAELTRVLLEYGGVEYEDERWSIDFAAGMKSDGFLAAKAAGELAQNLGRAPVLVVGGAALGQTKAMERYVARLTGLFGAGELEAAQIDALAEHVRDVKDAQRIKDFSMFSKQAADDKARRRAEWFETDLPSWLARIEAALDANAAPGYGLGAKRSYFDFTLWAAMCDSVRAGEDEAATAAALVAAPKLRAIVEAVDLEPAVQAWVARRPATRF
ncbi:hypothetical protein M885DRAFT_514810 [Pelagophyceae sp. CCMP2097]|nr:hypothetical protein M885DRAFT_514810 [Pelagophyceae sp. CCMP2097]